MAFYCLSCHKLDEGERYNKTESGSICLNCYIRSLSLILSEKILKSYKFIFIVLAKINYFKRYLIELIKYLMPKKEIKTKKSCNFINDFHDSYYDYGLGEVVKSKQHRNKLMKEKNLSEVGNERKYVSPEYIRKQEEQKEKKMYDDLKEKAIRRLWS